MKSRASVHVRTHVTAIISWVNILYKRISVTQTSLFYMIKY